MTTTYEGLEQAFGTVIERNRKGQTLSPCDREALFAHAFFHIDENEPDEIGFLPAGLPFASFWVITPYKGIAVCALVEPMGINPPFSNMPRPDYLWYPAVIPGERIRTTEAEIDTKAAFLVDRAIAALQRHHLQEVESSVQQSINRGRAKTIGKASYLPELPPFIRIVHDLAPETGHQGGTHASPLPHDRRGHWRTYRASGKRVWINECKVLGGAAVPRSYRIEETA